MPLYAFAPNQIEDVPDYLKTQEICDEAVRKDPWFLVYIPDSFNTQQMCEVAVEENPNI